MKKVVVFLASALLLATPMIAAADGGIIGDCSDCHTMHNSQQGQPVAVTGTAGNLSATPIQNLLKMDCIACHANPDAGGPLYTPGASTIPQVYFSTTSKDITTSLAGGNFYYSEQDQRNGHNVIDLAPANASNAGSFNAPPGMIFADTHADKFDAGYTAGGAPFGAFTCAGARGCHGTRSQVLDGTSGDFDSNAATPNTWSGARRTGIAAISGAHHNSYDGLKQDAGYTTESAHDGMVVAKGYRFIPGLYGLGNTADRWENKDATSHNEYYADAADQFPVAHGSCDECHVEGFQAGNSSRAATTSTLKVPGNDVSGFCGTCHGEFHSSGTENGTSGAFLRHPSDWVIPNSGEYKYYQDYQVTAPVGRPNLGSIADTTLVEPGTDEVMCLSCHEAHASPYNYMLRFDYTNMTAGGYADEAGATAEGGCLACHTSKGVLPEARTNAGTSPLN